MSQLFIHILNRSISAAYLILAVIVLRFLLRKAPKGMRSFLWLLVGLRLALPFSVEVPFSLVPADPVVVQEHGVWESYEVHSGIVQIDEQAREFLTTPPGDSADKSQVMAAIGSFVWLMGVLGMLGYWGCSWLLLKIRVRLAVPEEVEIAAESMGERKPKAFGQEEQAGKRVRIYRTDRIDSPFLFGLLHPRIYIPFSVKEEDLPYVIWHEKMHIYRGDHLIKPVGFLLLSLYWFHPLVWLSYFLLGRDIELACDERVVRALGAEHRIDYSQALLSCAAGRRPVSACPVAFGENGVRNRVKNILDYKKPAFWLLIAAAVACILAAIFFLTQKSAKVQSLPGDDRQMGELSGHPTEDEWSASVGTANRAPEEADKEEALRKIREATLEKIQEAARIKEQKMIGLQSLGDNADILEIYVNTFAERVELSGQEQVSYEIRIYPADESGIAESGETVRQGTVVSRDAVSSETESRNLTAQENQLPGTELREAELRYYVRTPEPHITVWYEKVTYGKVLAENGESTSFLLQGPSEEPKELSFICSAEELYLAYPEGKITDTMMDYYHESGNGAGESLNETARKNRHMEYYGALFRPDTAAVKLLNLLNNPNKVQVKEIQTFGDADACDVVFHFTEKGEDVTVSMYRIYEEDGIWLPAGIY